MSMSRKHLKPEECKIKFSITINPLLFNKMDEIHNNKSKYVERLIYKDLLKNNIIDKRIEI